MPKFGYIEKLEKEIRDANHLSSQTLATSAENCVDNTLGMIAVDAQCRVVADELVTCCVDLAEATRGLVLSEKQKGLITTLQEEALALAARLKQECGRCGPNRHARALRLD